MPKELNESFVHLSGEAKQIKIPGSFVVGTNPSAETYDKGYLLVFRASYTSLTDFLVKNLTINRNAKIGLCQLDKDLNVVSKPIYMNESAPGVHKKKQSPNDPRLIKVKDKYFVFYNDRVFDQIEKTYVRQMYMSQVTSQGFKTSKKIFFPESQRFTEMGNKMKNVEKNWSPFVFEDNLYLVYLIEPHVILKLDVDSGKCEIIEENSSRKLWDFGIAWGGTPCIKDSERYISIFHSHYNATPFLYSHKAYILGAYAFSAKPPFEITGVTSKPLLGDKFYDGLRKIVFPTGLVERDGNLLIFYGRDDQQMWVLKTPKKEFLALIDQP